MSVIKKPSEIEAKTLLKGLIYGVPGGGKTTLALSAPKPLLIDIDRGLQRVDPRYQCDSVQVSSYEDVIALLKEDLSGYDTIVVDTAGKLVDLMGEYVGSKNDTAKQSDGSLTQKGWGAVKSLFKTFFKEVEKTRKNLIFVAHENEEKDGEARIIRPDIAGGSKNALIKELDFMGYLEVVNKKRTLHLAPTAKFYAKNSIGVSDFLEVGGIEKENNFLSEVIFAQVQKAKAAESEKKKAYDALLAEMTVIVQSNPINMALATISNARHIWDSKLKSWNMLTSKAADLGYVYDKTTKQFMKPVSTEEPAHALPNHADAV